VVGINIRKRMAEDEEHGTINPNVSNAFERAGFISLKFSVLWILV
jgi:hypothetical protein